MNEETEKLQAINRATLPRKNKIKITLITDEKSASSIKNVLKRKRKSLKNQYKSKH